MVGRFLRDVYGLTRQRWTTPGEVSPRGRRRVAALLQPFLESNGSGIKRRSTPADFTGALDAGNVSVLLGEMLIHVGQAAVDFVLVDVPRNRIGLSLRLEDPAEAKPPAGAPRKAGPTRKPAKRSPARDQPAGGAIADALRRAGYQAGR
ncbi:MAG: hypothetical protein ACRDRX_02850 [Pseudonocardiaceae bacterium]